MPENTLFTYRTRAKEKNLLNPGSSAWRRAETITIDRDWQGQPLMRQKGLAWSNLTRVSSLWNSQTLFFYFECWYDQLNLNPSEPSGRPQRGLWETDVVEMFLKPKSCEDYFEIEVSPLGQWLDAHVREPRLDVDFHWDSGVRLETRISHQEKIWRVVAALPFQPLVEASQLESAPVVGDGWRLNLYRVAGEEPGREFLAWRPTFTQVPDFHIFSAFGNLIFLKD